MLKIREGICADLISPKISTQMKTFLKLTIFVFGLMLSTQTLSAQSSSFVQKYEPLAKELSRKYHIPHEVILAVAFVETGAGTSKGARLANNFFGIVGKNEVYKSKYRSFASAEESFEAFCKMITRKGYYQSLKGSQNLHDWVTHMAKAGYSTQPTVWKQRILSVIKRF